MTDDERRHATAAERILEALPSEGDTVTTQTTLGPCLVVRGRSSAEKHPVFSLESRTRLGTLHRTSLLAYGDRAEIILIERRGWLVTEFIRQLPPRHRAALREWGFAQYALHLKVGGPPGHLYDYEPGVVFRID